MAARNRFQSYTTWDSLPDDQYLRLLRDGFELDVGTYRQGKQIVKDMLKGDIPFTEVSERYMAELGHPNAAALANDNAIFIRNNYPREEKEYLAGHEALESQHPVGKTRPNKSPAEKEHVKLERLLGVVLGDLENDPEVGYQAKRAFEGFRSYNAKAVRSGDRLASALYTQIRGGDGYTHEDLIRDLFHGYRARDNAESGKKGSGDTFGKYLRNLAVDAAFWPLKGLNKTAGKAWSSWNPFSEFFPFPDIAGSLEGLVNSAFTSYDQWIAELKKEAEAREKAPAKPAEKTEGKKPETK